jgi:hypothetical protein
MQWELSGNAVILSTEYHGSIVGVSWEYGWSMIQVDRFGPWHMKIFSMFIKRHFTEIACIENVKIY